MKVVRIIIKEEVEDSLIDCLGVLSWGDIVESIMVSEGSYFSQEFMFIAIINDLTRMDRQSVKCVKMLSSWVCKVVWPCKWIQFCFVTFEFWLQFLNKYLKLIQGIQMIVHTNSFATLIAKRSISSNSFSVLWIHKLIKLFKIIKAD